jgi:hypothetical protein
MGGLFLWLLRFFAIAAAIALALWQPNPAWIESAYSNGAYAAWQHAIFPLGNALPWSLGDVFALAGIGALAWRIASALRMRRRSPMTFARALLDVAAILAVYAIWFFASWGLNYARAPIEARTAFDAARINDVAMQALRARAIARMNALAAPAHAEASAGLDLAALQTSWTPVVQASGDRWTPWVGAPKPTLADPFMSASGTSGFINPLSLTVQLASDLLWFERPFSLAHEWSHIAAFAREDEANYLAILTCTRSRDPAVAYSGWLELFLYLPPQRHYARSEFSPLVWADFDAIRRRNARHLNATIATWSWRTYNVYLKSNRVAAGVESYNEVTRLLLGVRLDAQGLPLGRADAR